jgi:hypothetical protein
MVIAGLRRPTGTPRILRRRTFSSPRRGVTFDPSIRPPARPAAAAAPVASAPAGARRAAEVIALPGFAWVTAMT